MIKQSGGSPIKHQIRIVIVTFQAYLSKFRKLINELQTLHPVLI